MAFLFEIPAEGYRIGLDWLGKFAQVIIEGVGSIGFGIIIFTLVLKAITLPFDIYQRVKMRKQNLIMKQMQPELEKLQKQYANDKDTYNKKMMELYKKSGYSMFGACLPMIISLVILIVAFQGFRTYSQYANLSMYENMSSVYNAAILEYSPAGVDYTLCADDEEETETAIKWNDDLSWKSEDGSITYTMYYEGVSGVDENGQSIITQVKYLRVSPTELSGEKFIWYRYSLEAPYIEKQYMLDENAMKQNERIAETIKEIENFDKLNVDVRASAYRSCVAKIGAEAVRDWYGKGKAGFLWVKNVWYPDVSYNHPIQSYAKLKNELTKKVTLETGEKKALSSVLTETQYQNITSELTDAKKQPNGYFVLIILSIGFMVLSQFISMRSSKESNQYQTVDGQGAKTQKMMMIIMPVIYAIFAFMYSAAFSIYMTMSSIVSLLVTVISNLVIGRIFKKKEKAEVVERYSRRYEWQKSEKEKKQDEKKAKKEQKKNKNTKNKK